MNKSRRIGAIVAVATTAVGVASLVASAPASAAAARGPQPVSGWLRPVRAHTPSRVDIYWRTDRTVCDVQVRVVGQSVDVDYAGNQPFASFNRGTMLRSGQTDYTSVQINPDFDQAGTARLRAIVSYDSCRFHARTQTSSYSLTLPVLRNDTWPGHGFPGGPGNGGHGHGGPGNGGHGDGGPGNGGHGDGGPGNGGHGDGGPGNGGHGDGGPGNGGHGDGGPGNGGHGDGGPGNGGHGDGGPGNGGHGDGGQGNNPGGPHHGQPTSSPSPTIASPALTTNPTSSPTASPTTSPTAPGNGNGSGNGHGNGNGSGSGNGGHGHGNGGQDQPTTSPVRR